MVYMYTTINLHVYVGMRDTSDIKSSEELIKVSYVYCHQLTINRYLSTTQHSVHYFNT